MITNPHFQSSLTIIHARVIIFCFKVIYSLHLHVLQLSTPLRKGENEFLVTFSLLSLQFAIC